MKSRRIWDWVLFACVSAMVFRGAVVSPRQLPEFLIKMNDKLVHGTEYFLLFLVSVNAFRKSSRRWLSAYPYCLSFGYCLLMGAVTEIVKIYIPERISDITDWLGDGAGALTAWALLFLISWVFKLTRSPRELL